MVDEQRIEGGLKFASPGGRNFFLRFCARLSSASGLERVRVCRCLGQHRVRGARPARRRLFAPEARTRDGRNGRRPVALLARARHRQRAAALCSDANGGGFDVFILQRGPGGDHGPEGFPGWGKAAERDQSVQPAREDQVSFKCALDSLEFLGASVVVAFSDDAQAFLRTIGSSSLIAAAEKGVVTARRIVQHPQGVDRAPLPGGRWPRVSSAQGRQIRSRFHVSRRFAVWRTQPFGCSSAVTSSPPVCWDRASRAEVASPACAARARCGAKWWSRSGRTAALCAPCLGPRVSLWIAAWL